MIIKVKFFFILSLIFFTSFFLHAATSCNSVDLNESENSPLRKMQIYDQDGSGSCYAHAAAQLYNYNLLKRGGSLKSGLDPVYGAWLSTLDKEGINGSTDGGNVAMVLDAVSKYGVCPQEKVDQHFSKFKNQLDISNQQVMHFLEIADSSRNNLNTRYMTNRLAMDKNFSSCQIKRLSNEKLLRQLADKSSIEAGANLFKRCHREKVKTPTKDYINLKGNDVDKNAQSIAKALSSHKPVAIGFCSTVLKDPSYRFSKGLFSFMDSYGLRALPDDCGGHATLITAQKVRHGSCQYLIRNSWGADWNPKGVSCACYDKREKYYEDCSQVRNVKEYVGCWYEAKNLLPNTVSLTTL